MEAKLLYLKSGPMVDGSLPCVEEHEGLVAVVVLRLERLMKKNPILFYEFVMKCRDVNHQFFGDTEAELAKMDFFEADGRIHDSIRNVVLASVAGDMLEMRLVNPYNEI